MKNIKNDDYALRSVWQSILFFLIMIIARASLIIAFPYFIHHASLYDVGVGDSCQSIFSYLILLLSSSTIPGFIRFFVQAHDRNQRSATITHCFFMLGLGTFLITLFWMLFYYGGFSCCWFVYVPLIIVTSVLYTIFSLILAYYRVTQKLFFYACLLILQNGIAALAMIWLVHSGYAAFSITGGILISLLFISPLFFYFCLLPMTIDRVLLFQQFSYSIPMVGHTVLYAFFLYTDRFLVQHCYGLEMAGLYSILWRYGGLYQFFSYSVYDVLMPLLYQAYEKNDDANVLILLVHSALGMLMIVGIVSVVIIVFTAPYILPAAYSTMSYAIIPYFILLVLSEVVRMVHLGFQMIKKTKQGCMITFLGSAAYGMSCFFMISYGINHMLYAGAGVIGLQAIVIVWILHKKYQVNIIFLSSLIMLIGLLVIPMMMMHVLFLNHLYIHFLVVAALAIIFISWYVFGYYKQKCNHYKSTSSAPNVVAICGGQ